MIEPPTVPAQIGTPAIVLIAAVIPALAVALALTVLRGVVIRPAWRVACVSKIFRDAYGGASQPREHWRGTHALLRRPPPVLAC